ncbi:MAG: OmpA family protein [Flavobacteriales bacterium]
MKPKIIFLGGLLFYCLNSFATQVDITVHFAKDSYEIDAATQKTIETWASTHFQHRRNKVYLRGHTDQDAENDYNITLSKNRNNAVKALLESRGFTNIEQQHFGEDRLICDSPDETCKCQNRRVEIVLIDDAYELWEEESILPKKNVTRLDLTKDQIIALPGGTIIHFYKNSIVNAQGEVVTNPIVETRELYTINESILGNVTTECAGDLLQSGGMIEVRAYSGSEELQIAPGTSFEVAFKNNSQEQEDMQPFYGKVVNGKMTWQTEKQQGINKRASLIKSNLKNSDREVITQNGNLIFFPKKMGSHVILKNESNKKYLEDLMRRPADKIYYADLVYLGILAKESEPEVKEEIKRRAEENYQLLDAKGNDMISYVLTEIDLNFIQRQAMATDSLRELMQTPMELVKFGWINCDRFMNSKEDLVNNKCIVNSEIQFTSMLMIPETFSLMSSYSEQNEFTFSNIPLRYAKTVICTHKLDDGTILFGYAQFPENSIYVEIDEFETLTSQEFEEKIKYLASL